jgi:hypothetical protein
MSEVHAEVVFTHTKLLSICPFIFPIVVNLYNFH